nr:MAG TPA: hypothetical protein [Caudoviricetes sp.]
MSHEIASFVAFPLCIIDSCLLVGSSLYLFLLNTCKHL